MEDNNNVINQTLEVNQRPMKTRKLLALKIIVAVLYVVATIFFASVYIDEAINGDKENAFRGLIVLVIIIYGLIFYTPILITSLISTILSGVWLKKKVCTISTFLYFLVFCVVIILTYFTLIWIAPLVL